MALSKVIGEFQIKCSTEGATIRYEINTRGESPEDPNELSTPYEGKTQFTWYEEYPYTIKAKAWKDGIEPSDVAVYLGNA